MTQTNTYHKDFAGWSQAKPEIHNIETPPLFREREIWWCNIGVNIGTEVDGNKAGSEISYFYTRPVLILKKLSAHSFIAIPMSKKIKQGSWYYPVEFKNGSVSNLLFHQMRSFDARRLTNRISKMGDQKFGAIKNVFVNFMIE